MTKKLNLPNVYSVYVKSLLGSVLHMGVYTNLEDAYGAAKDKLEASFPHRKGTAVDLDMWNILPVEELVPFVLPAMKTSVKPPVKDVKIRFKEAKGDLLKAIIDNNDLQLLKEMSPYLTSNEKKYIKSKVAVA